MKLLLAGPSCALALAMCTAGPAAAQDVTFTFTGTLTAADNSPFPELAAGTPFTGSYTMSLASPDQNPLAQIGDYWHAGAPDRHHAADRRGLFFRTSTTSAAPPSPQFLVEVIDDYFDLGQ